MIREQRNHNAPVRASPGEELRLTGYAAVFNTASEDLGGFTEEIAPGAFRDNIITNDVRALWNHNPDYVLGRNKAGTLTLTEDGIGLLFDVRLPDTQWAKDLHESVRRGDVDQCSFGFIVLEDAWRTVDGQQRRTLKRVQLLDVSAVTYPAYEATTLAARNKPINPPEIKRPTVTKRQRQRLALKEKSAGMRFFHTPLRRGAD